MTSIYSHWWYLVAGVFLWGIVSTVLVITSIILGWGGTLAVLLAYAAIALLALLPIGLYLDGRKIVEAEVDWEPDITLYVVGGIIGIFIPLLSVAVAGLYLYRRHEHVGTP